MNEKDRIVLYEDEQGNVELRTDADNDTLWATQDQIARLFDTTKQNIGLHFKNIFISGELIANSVVKDSFTTGADGKRYKVKMYNLDAMIAVGYRVNSKKATKFRIWATGIIKRFIVTGYALSHDKLSKSSQDLENLNNAIAILQSPELKGKIKAKIKVNITKDLI